MENFNPELKSDFDSIPKQNDWFLAISENPSFSLGNFENVGLSPVNTGLKSKDFYRKSNYIQEKFSDNEGSFNEDAFSKTYDVALSSYNAFSQNAYDKETYDNIPVYWNRNTVIKPKDGLNKDIGFTMFQDFNPDRLSKGIVGLDMVGERTQTRQWLARQQDIYNSEINGYEGETLDDRTFFTNPLSYMEDLTNPLVLATWDEDGEHEDAFSGKLVEHKKGEYKFNDEGTYYYERLNGRDPINKEFKTAFDNVIAIDSPLKKYDFLDSTVMDKSVPSIIFKTALKLAPFAIPGVGEMYAASMVGLELTHTLGNLYRMSFGLNSEENSTINTVLGITKGLKDDQVSEHAQANSMAFENLMKISEGVFFQWAEQRALFKGMNKLLGTEKAQKKAFEQVDAELAAMQKKLGETEVTKLMLQGRLSPTDLSMARQAKAAKLLGDTMKRNNNISRNLSVMYMSSMQGLTMFDEAIAQGVDEKDAALVAIGGTLGIYGVIRKMGLGELFLPEMMKGEAQTLPILRNASKIINKQFIKGSGELPKEMAKRGPKIITKVRDLTGSFFSNVRNHTTTAVEKMVGSGIEEVVQQMAMDASRGIYNLNASMGLTGNDSRLNVWEGMGERYGSAFVGGFIGAGLFYGLDFRKIQAQMDAQEKQTLIKGLSEYGIEPFLEDIEKARAKGLFGDTNLSATKSETDSNGNVYFLAAENKSDTQNEYVADQVKQYVTHVNEVLTQEGLNITEDSAIDKFIQYQQRSRALEKLYKVQDGRFEDVAKDSVLGLPLQKLLDAQQEVVDTKLELEGLEKDYADGKKKNTETSNPDPTYIAKKEELTKKLEGAKFKAANIFSEDSMRDLTGLTLFAMDEVLSSFFIAPNFRIYAEMKSSKDFASLTEGEIESLQKQYDIYNSSSKKNDIEMGYKMYVHLTEKLKGSIEQLGDKKEAYINFKKEIIQDYLDYEAIQNRYNSVKNTDEAGETMAITEFEGSDRSLNDILQPELTRVGDVTSGQTALKLLELTKKHGYADAQVKELIMKYVPEMQTEQALHEMVDEAFKKMDQDPNIQDVDQADAKVLHILRSMTPDNIDSISEQAEANLKSYLDAKHKKAIVEIYRKLVAENPKIGIAEVKASQEFVDFTQKTTEKYNKIFESAIKSFQSKIKDYNSVRFEVEKELQTLSENPIYAILQQMYIQETGEKSSIIDVLDRESRRFKDTKAVSEYTLAGADNVQEMETIFGLMLALQATLHGARNETSTIGDPFGHNIVYNELLKTNDESLLRPVLEESLSNTLTHDLNDVALQLSFYNQLSEVNLNNQFRRHSAVGLKISHYLYNAMKAKDQYGFIANMGYNGIGLFDGIEELDLPSMEYLTKEQNYSDNENTLGVNRDLNKMQDLVYENFQKILKENPDKTITEILDVIFKDVYKNLDGELREMYTQDSTEVNSNMKGITNYHLVTDILSMIALKKSDYDAILYKNLISEDVKYAPLYVQEHISKLALSITSNPEIMNYAIDLARITGNSYKFKLYNTLVVDGGAGVGKTRVILNSYIRALLDVDPNSKFVLAGPTQQQVDNLSQAFEQFKDNATTHIVEDLLIELIGQEQFDELSGYINENNKDNKFYKTYKTEFDDDGKMVEGTEIFDEVSQKNVAAKQIVYHEGSIDFSQGKGLDSKTRAILVDESTHVNSIYSKIISEYAKANNMTVVLAGDQYQVGYSNSELALYNNESESSIAVRAPRLDLRMRSSNSHKAENDKKMTILMNESNVNKIYKEKLREFGLDNDLKAVDYVLKHTMDNVTSLIDSGKLKFTYYEGEDGTLNGDKLTTEITKEQINKLLDKYGELGYIYENKDSETYHLLESMKDERIKLFTPATVQGSQMDIFIIDADFSNFKRDMNPSEAYSIIKKYNTMVSRAKEGSLIIDNGVSSDLFVDNFVKADRTSRTPEGEVIISRFRDTRLKQLELALDGKTEHNIKFKESEIPEVIKPEEIKPDDEVEIVPEEEVKITPEEEIVDDDNLIIDEPEPLPIPKPKPIKIIKSSLSDEFLEMIEMNRNKIADYLNADVEFSEDGVRAYSFYNRSGLVENKDGTFSVNKSESSNGIQSDMNIFLEGNENLTKEEFRKRYEVLKLMRDKYLRGRVGTGEPLFDSEWIDILKNELQLASLSDLSLNYWNSGEFAIEVRNTVDGIDTPIDMFNYDSSKVDKVSYNLVYRIAPSESSFATKVITLAKLPSSDTWLNNANATNKSKANDYAMWYRYQKDALQAEINKNPNKTPVFYYKVDEVNTDTFQGLIKETDSKGKPIILTVEQAKKAYPDAVFSEEAWGYSGLKQLDQLGARDTLAIHNSVKGKAVILVTNYTQHNFLNKNGDMVKPTPKNIHELYEVRQDQKREIQVKVYDEMIKKGYTEAQASAIAKAEAHKQLPPRFRMLLLNPASRRFRDFIKIDTKQVVDLYGKGTKDSGAFTGTFGGNQAAARMIAGLFNMRANYAIFNDVLEAYQKQTNTKVENWNNTQRAEFNKALDLAYWTDSKDVAGQYANTTIRLFTKDSKVPEGKQSSELGTAPINMAGDNELVQAFLKGNSDAKAEVFKKHIGIYTTPDMAINGEVVLSTILEAISYVLSIPNSNFNITDTNSSRNTRKMFMATDINDTTGNPDRRMSDLINRLNTRVETKPVDIEVKGEKVRLNDGDILTYDENGNPLVHKAFELNGAWKMSLIIGRLYDLMDTSIPKKMRQSTINKDKYIGPYMIEVIDSKTSKPVEINLQAFFGRLKDQARVKEGALMTTVDGILQMAIHGNLKESTPYNYSKAPMPYGIFERVVFKTLNQADPFDLFPIYNISNDFKLDVFPRSLSFNVKFNPSKAQKIVDVNSPAVVRRSFETAAKEINAKMVSNLGKHNGIEFLLNKLAEKFAVKAENSTDSQIPSLVQDYLAESQKIIEERGVKDRLIMFNDGDIALDAHVDENGIVVEHTLFDEIQKQTGQELYKTSEDNQRLVNEDLADGKIRWTDTNDEYALKNKTEFRYTYKGDQYHGKLDKNNKLEITKLTLETVNENSIELQGENKTIITEFIDLIQSNPKTFKRSSLLSLFKDVPNTGIISNDVALTALELLKSNNLTNEIKVVDGIMNAAIGHNILKWNSDQTTLYKLNEFINALKQSLTPDNC